MLCKACGNQLLEGAGFCGYCGAPVGEAATIPVGAPADAPVDTFVYSPGDQPTEIRPGREVARGPAAGPAVIPGAGPAVIPAVGPEVIPPPPPVFSPPPPAPPVYGGAYVQPGPAGYPAQMPPGPGAYGAPPSRKSRLGLWLGIAAAVVILAGAGVAVWQLVFDKHDTPTTTTVVVKPTSTTVAASSTTSTSAATTTTSGDTSTTLALPTAAPGDSVGQWAEMDIPGLPSGAYAVAVSDQALLVDAKVGDTYSLYAYMFDTKQSVQLPIEASDFSNEDIDGNIAVWWEGDYNQDTGEYSNEHIYAYPLPNGPKVEITGGGSMLHYPQISGSWVTWAQDEPFADDPEEYSLVHIWGVTIDSKGAPQGDPVELVSEATAYTQGDYGWSYSLSGTHLAWENATTVGTFDPGLYRMDLGSKQPVIVGNEVWRPSLGGNILVYTDVGLVTMNADGGDAKALDPLGDFASAASTFAAYFRSVDNAGTTTYQIVARGFTGAYEQVLGEQTDAPWLSAPIAASDHHVAFITDDTAHVFEWQGTIKTY